VESVQEKLSGTVRLKLFKGAYAIVARNAAVATSPVMIRASQGLRPKD
jgi:argininosuccinate synthase